MKHLVLACSMLLAIITNGQSLSGTIYDENKEPLYGALVKVGEFGSTFTNEEGEFVVVGVNSGEKFELLIQHVSFETMKEIIDHVEGTAVEFYMVRKSILINSVEVSALRVDDRTPFAESTVDRERIESMDFGLDVPFLMDLEPSVVTTSDAGTGIGYTGMRVRGSDASRVNVTINGVPLNDAESSTVFWVDLPDLAASTQDIQVQRGVGTSTNGPGAFGASVNLRTAAVEREAYGRVSAFGGSFNTRKFNVAGGTGLLNEQFSFDMRLSKVNSDGFIDRATADMNGYYLQGAWSTKKSLLRLIGFGGHEETYQAWGGVPSDVIDTSRTFNGYTYDNEVDDYGQQHYQLLFDHKLNDNTQFNITLFRTDGSGFFEQYKDEEDLSDYFIAPVIIGADTINTSDIIRRRWLDNTLTGVNASVQTWINERHRLIVGGGYSAFDGAHFGEVIWAQYAATSQIRDRYYDNNANKKDGNVYAKYTHALSAKTDLFADLQYRTVNYDFLGVDASGSALDQGVSLGFFNPKAGITIRPMDGLKTYLSVAVGNKEPNRSDYTESAPDKQAVSESLIDYELGAQLRRAKHAFGINFYYMDYTDQLVLTGELNDVGDAKRINVPESYRAGVELTWGVALGSKLKWKANAAFSSNKIKNFTEYIDNWDTWAQDEVFYEETDIAFSPSVIAGSELTFRIWDGKEKGRADIALLSKYVGKQYLDNSSNEGVAVDPWFVNDIRLNWHFGSVKGIKDIAISFVARNILNEEYESNGWSYSYSLGGERAQLVGLYPQAGVNFLGGLTMKF